MDKFYIKGNVPSSKNSKVFTGKFLVNSKTVQKYLKTYGKQWEDQELIQKFKLGCKEFPIKLHMKFIRDTKRRCDLVNLAQYPLDLMVKNGWLPDDDYTHVIPVFEQTEIDKNNAGLIFWIDDTA